VRYIHCDEHDMAQRKMPVESVACVACSTGPRPVLKFMLPHKSANLFTARDIARGLKTYKKAVHRRAAREGWPRRRSANQFIFLPPAGLRRHLLQSVPTEFRRETLSPGSLHISPARLAELARAEQRLRALLLFLQFRPAFRIQRALQRAARFSTVGCSVASLRRWACAWQRAGFAGLLEQKRGRVGRRKFESCAAPLTGCRAE